MGLNKSNIDYLAQAKEAIGRPGYTLNIVTGCKHWDMPEICVLGKSCYAYNLVVNGRLKNAPSYPYGFLPTFHPERVRAYGGKPKLIFLNDMGDCGGAWKWFNYEEKILTGTRGIANEMRRFALLNPAHILLLLTKNPSWYRYAEWPDNVWCGFTATNNEELFQRTFHGMPDGIRLNRTWLSLEPWLDEQPPPMTKTDAWLVIGGLSGKGAGPVSEATLEWLCDPSIQAKRFTKENAYSWKGYKYEDADCCPCEYPESWRCPNDQ